MAWVDIVEARGAADQPLDAGMTHAVHLRLEQIYSQGVYNHTVLQEPWDDDSEKTVSTDWSVWNMLPIPVLARPTLGGAPRNIGVEVEARGEDSTLLTTRVYFLATRIVPPVDTTDAILGEASYVEFTVQSVDYSFRTGTLTTPGPTDVLRGDGTIAGFAQPVWWLHFVSKSALGSKAMKWRKLRLWEVLP